MMNNPEENKKEQTKTTRFLTPNQFGTEYPWAPIGGIRHLIFNAKTNGFDKVIRRVGRAILIDENKFFEWMATHNSEGMKLCFND